MVVATGSAGKGAMPPPVGSSMGSEKYDPNETKEEAGIEG